MSTSAKFLVFAGSTRDGSYNKKLARLAEKKLRDQNVAVTYLDLRELPMPLYDGDLEAEKGIPENGLKFREILKNYQAFLICSPEYNSSISGVLKNAIDWASRPLAGEADLVCFRDKIITLLSASPGQLGGLRGLVTVRSILGNIGAIVLPNQLSIPLADKAFTADGNLVNDVHQKTLEKICDTFVRTVNKLV